MTFPFPANNTANASARRGGPIALIKQENGQFFHRERVDLRKRVKNWDFENSHFFLDFSLSKNKKNEDFFRFF